MQKNKLTKLLSVVVSLMMVLCAVSVTAFAADGDFTIEDGVLTAYNGEGGNVIIPESVTKIGAEVFAGKNITSVSMPGVEDVCESAFADCSDLTSVSMPNVVLVDRNAFSNCPVLADVIISTKLCIVGKNAFDYGENIPVFNFICGTDPDEAADIMDMYFPIWDYNILEHNVVNGVCTICGAEGLGCDHANACAGTALEPTCGAAGHTAGIYCPDCNTWIEAQQEIPATGNHTFVDGVCSVCGEAEEESLLGMILYLLRLVIGLLSYLIGLL